jgi:hypothetical protein
MLKEIMHWVLSCTVLMRYVAEPLGKERKSSGSIIKDVLYTYDQNQQQ